MATATTTKTKLPKAGSKRKAEEVKEVRTKDSKKVKVDKAQKPLKSKAPKESKATKEKSKPSVTKSARAPFQQDSNSEDEDDSDVSEDGGVPLGADVDMEDEEEDKENELEGVHPDRVKAVAPGAGPNGTSSREAHAKQRQLVAERKAAKPLADQLARSKKLWERLRRKSHVPLEERKKLIEELFEIITGKVKDFCFKHDSVRVIQTAIKYANLEQKKMITRELQGTFRQLAESKYAKFLIGKLLVLGDAEIRDIIVPEFYGYVRKLIKHPEASWILDDVYRGIATDEQKAIILREWYGAEFAIFQKEEDKKVSADLSAILADKPEKRAPIMRSLQELINHLIQKKMTGFTMLHDAMLQYFLNCKAGSEEITDYIELIKGEEEGDLLKNLAFTKPGSRVVCLALAYGTAKDRKHILKTYKETLQLMSSDPNAHLVILTAYEVIDDTVLTAKSIFPELFGKDAEKQVENIVFYVNNLVARTVLLYLFQGRSKSLFPASLANDLTILAEVDSIRPATSKKEPEIRRKELVKAISPYLLTAVTSAANELVQSTAGCTFITEVLFGAEGDKSAALQAVAETPGGDPAGAAEEEQPEVEEEKMNMHEDPSVAPQHLSLLPSGGKMLKALIAGGPYNFELKKVVPVDPPLNFASLLYPVIKPHILAWATGPSSWVVLNLLEAEGFEKKKDLVKILAKSRKELEKAAMEETPEQKEAKRVATEEEPKKKKKGKKAAAGTEGKERLDGNAGSRAILKLLV